MEAERTYHGYTAKMVAEEDPKLKRVLEAARWVASQCQIAYYKVGQKEPEFNISQRSGTQLWQALQALDAPEPKKPRYEVNLSYGIYGVFDHVLNKVIANCMTQLDAREYADWLNSRDS